MNEGTSKFTREELRQIAEETLKALGVEPVEMSEEERGVIRRAVEEWRNRKKAQTKRNEGL